MTEHSIKALHILTVRYGKNGLTRCAMNYITHFTGTRADLACGFPLPESVPEDFTRRGARAVSLPPRLRRPLSYYRALTKLLREERYDIVQMHGNSCTMALELLAATRAGVPVRVPHAHNTQCSAKLLHRLLRPLFERCRTGAFACGKEAGEWLYQGKPFTVVRNAIDTAAFAFDESARIRTRGALGLDGCFVVGHVGGFTAQKNQMALLFMLTALRKINPNAALLMVGDGPLRADIERAVKDMELPGCVRIVPAADDVASLYAAMDAFALPSLFEGLPFALIEAQANGLPCFSSDAVTREAGMGGLVRFLPADATPDGWAAAIAAGGDGERAARGGLAAERIRESGYSIAQEAAALEALYRRMLPEARA